MTNKELQQADMLDILFEHRNKSYGAYALRRHYNERLGKALGISFATVLLCISFLFFRNTNESNGPGNKNKGAVILNEVDFEKEKIKEPEREKTPDDLRKAKSSSNIIIIGDETDVEEQDEIRDAVVSNVTKEGKELEDPNTVINDSEPPTSNLQPETQSDPEPLPSYAPSFPGGSSAWLNYLRKFLQTPDELEAGQRIEVQVKFWVEIDGSVSRFEIIKSGGREFDKEVLRVMKKMPKWEAAMQNGQKIAVSFTQPVIFLGVEED